MIRTRISERDDCEVLFISYNDIIADAEASVGKLCDFLAEADLDSSEMLAAVDPQLHRNRR